MNRPAPDSYHHGNLRDALVQAALEALERDGPAALSLRNLARAVGVSPTAVYRHFANKDDLMATIATEGFEGLSAEMQRRLGSEPDADALRRLMILGEGYSGYAMSHPAHYRLMFGRRMVDKDDYPALARAAAHSYGMLEQAVAGAVDAGQLPDVPVALLSTMAWSLVHGLSTLHNDGMLTDKQLPRGEALGETFTRMLALSLRHFAPGKE
ncbi:MAG: TetR/AcrR family transcriptional regulator [Alcanivoracaceae bacterium]|jgi:AcrR family transcriptional regulator|nr:TetR/AcrR family transcriptional regulator [Alcanivoracaceae bacterium]